MRRRAHRARALEVLRLPDSTAPRRPAAAEGPAAFAPRSSAGISPRIWPGRHGWRMMPLPSPCRCMAESLRDCRSRRCATTATSVEVPAALLGNGEHFALEVAGDSMVDAGILDGDIVIIKRTDTAENGDIVVALVDENEVTLKRLRRRGNSIALEAANPRYETRIFGPDRVRVQGRLVALIRRY